MHINKQTFVENLGIIKKCFDEMEMEKNWIQNDRTLYEVISGYCKILLYAALPGEEDGVPSESIELEVEDLYEMMYGILTNCKIGTSEFVQKCDSLYDTIKSYY